MATTLQEQIAVVPAGQPDRFVSVANPGQMGNASDIAYGGCAIGAAIRAACETVDPKYRLYSVLGTYLGPASAEAKLACAVRRVRDTRTFATRQVEVSQNIVADDAGAGDAGGGTTRLCMIVLLDFQVREESLVVPEYSTPPSQTYSAVAQCPTPHEATDRLVRERVVPEPLVEMFFVGFELQQRFFDTRGCPEGVAANNLYGMAKKRAPTPQDDRPLPAKTSGDWFRTRHPLISPADHYAGLGFVLDGALSFLPLTHSGLFFDDAGPCSSLEFAMRIFTPDVDLSQWHLRELRTITGRAGRTYSEARLWDEEGRMVANMTQQSILRPARFSL